MVTSTSQLQLATSQPAAKPETEKPKERVIKLPLKAQVLKTPDGIISEAGQNEIEWLLSNHLASERSYHPIPDDFEWQWATNRGTLPKRIQAFYYKTHNVKLTPSIITELGNMGKRHASTAQSVVIDFTDDIDWSDGDFGDSGSCFWGDKSGAKLMIEKNGFAMRAFRAKDCTKPPVEGEAIIWQSVRGYARCWVADIGNKIIVFNGYGESTLVFARWLSLIFGCTYKRIGLANNGYDDGTLWINGGVGYIVGHHAEIAPFTKHDLGWPDESDDRYWCEVCEDRVDEDDAYQAVTARGNRITTCSDCSAECDNCSERFAYDLKRFEGESYCSACHETVVRDALDEAKSAVERAEKRVSSAEDELSEAREELREAEEKVSELEVLE